MNGPLWLDLSHTSHAKALTGIQRVARGLWRSLGPAARPLVFDPYEQAWRDLGADEIARLSIRGPATKRSAIWSWRQRWRGRYRRWSGRVPANLGGESAGLIVPEIFSSKTAAALPDLFHQVAGPRIALFHDAIALQRPELMPPSVAKRFPSYLLELARFDGIAAISETTRRALVDYWAWVGVPHPPPVEALPLGIHTPPPGLASTVDAAGGRHAGPPVMLVVCTIEGRKNHEAFLDACELLWRRGRRFQVRLIGLARPETARGALDKIRAFQAAGRPLRYDGAVDDGRLEAAYAEAAFTVYPSLLEGFGLPVVESLIRGKPCVCSATGAVGEIAAGGGCLGLASVDASSLADACERLMLDEAERARLGAEARARRFRTADDYAGELTAWMKTLPRRTP